MNDKLSEKELIEYAKPILKANGFKKKGKRWIRTDAQFTRVFFIQGSCYDKNDYYIRPGIYINELIERVPATAVSVSAPRVGGDVLDAPHERCDVPGAPNDRLGKLRSIGGLSCTVFGVRYKKAPAGGCFFMILRLLSDYPFREFARTIAPIGSICCSCSNISSYLGSPRFA